MFVAARQTWGEDRVFFLDDEGPVDRYEQLRRHALDGDEQGWRLGLALLHRRGVAGWLRAWDDLPVAAPAALPASAVSIVPGDAAGRPARLDGPGLRRGAVR